MQKAGWNEGLFLVSNNEFNVKSGTPHLTGRGRFLAQLGFLLLTEELLQLNTHKKGKPE
jgi:hypothetical protein